MQENQIINLLNSASLSAPDVTRPLKSIGNGNMLDGLKIMCSFSYNEGKKNGAINGAIIGGVTASCVFGIFCVARKCVKQVQCEFSKIKNNNEFGGKIQNAFKGDLNNAEMRITENEMEKEMVI